MSKTKQIVAETPKELADVLDLPDATAQEWQDYRHMQCNNLLNDFAYRCFRDVADGDYISARMACRADLIPQALWASQQAMEKYIKCILLLRRIPWRERHHSLVQPLARLKGQFPLRLSPVTREFIKYLDEYGYFPLTKPCGKSAATASPIIEGDLRHIEAAESRPPLSPGLLDAVRRESKHPARAALVWKNLYFSGGVRKSVKMKQRMGDGELTAGPPP